MEDLKDIVDKLDEILDTNLCILKIEDGSIILTFHCLHELDTIFPLSSKQEEELQKIGVRRIYSDKQEYYRYQPSSKPTSKQEDLPTSQQEELPVSKQEELPASKQEELPASKQEQEELLKIGEQYQPSSQWTKGTIIMQVASILLLLATSLILNLSR